MLMLYLLSHNACILKIIEKIELTECCMLIHPDHMKKIHSAREWMDSFTIDEWFEIIKAKLPTFFPFRVGISISAIILNKPYR